MASSSLPTVPDPREAALLAAQARIAGPSAISETPTSPPPAREWTGPSEKQDRDYRIKLARVIEKEVIGGNSYTVSAACIETLLQIATNILSNPSEPKYRLIKATSHVLKNKVLSAKGGQEALVLIGFRSFVVDFVKQYKLEPTEEKMHMLGLAKELLDQHLLETKKRAAAALLSHSAAVLEESSRKAEALAQIEDDREKVRARVERERLVREARQQREREAGVSGELRHHEGGS